MMHFFWLAFEDERAVPGTRARGAVILPSHSDREIDVLARANALIHRGHLPTALLEHTVHLAEVEPRHGPPQAAWLNRHLTNDEAAAVAQAWTGGVASRQQIRDAFADDDAVRGTPLFPPAILRGGRR